MRVHRGPTVSGHVEDLLFRIEGRWRERGTLVIAAARVDQGNNAADYDDGTGDRQTDGGGGIRGPLLAPGQSTRRVSDAFVRLLGGTGS